jgi:formylglycine-generating enzyme required for sulfatase activity
MPASCAATDAGPLDGIDDCGSSMSDSCCATLPVTAGTYFRTYAVSDAGAATAEGDPAEVSRFELDKYPVTVGRFLRYVGYLANGGAAPVAGSGTHTQLNGGNGLVADPGGGFETGWDSAWDVSLPTGPGALAMWTAQLAACPDATWGVGVDAGVSGTLPVNCVTWYEAYAFCIWDGGFLPSEAEWEYAAGGALQVPYPWGFTTPGPLDVASYAIVGCDYGGPGCGVGSVAPVGSAPSGVGPFGQLDLLGEVEEWTLDAYAGAYPVPCDDCAELPSMGALRVVRGAAWSSPLTAVTVRASQDPATTAAPLGLRCARSPGT